MKASARYAKVVEWSDEDNCYVGSAPGLIYGGCHGDDEQLVFEELCRIVDEVIELYRTEGKPLPPATSARDLANRLQNVAWPDSRRTHGLICPVPCSAARTRSGWSVKTPSIRTSSTSSRTTAAKSVMPGGS